MNVLHLHQETFSEGLRSVATPVLVVFLCCAIATVYSLGKGRSKVKGGVQREESVELVPEGEKVCLFEETCSPGFC
jgi:hypothetical protein